MRDTTRSGRHSTPLALLEPAAPTHRLLLPTRGVLVAFGMLTALAVVALLVGADHTDEAFAWTIQPPVGAAFLGAAYGAGCLVVLLTLRAGSWAQARWPLLSILAFTVLTLVATLMHLDRFHFTEGATLPRIAAWFWLGVYVVVPPAMSAVMLVQERAYRRDVPAAAPASSAPLAFTASLGVQGVVMSLAGVALFLTVDPVVSRWPWLLTPLVAQVVGAWLVSFGIAAFLAVRSDFRLLRPAAASYAAFGVLELLALALHRDELTGGAATVVVVALALWVAATGAWGAWASGARRAD